MRINWIRWGVILIAFIGSLIGFSIFFNQGATDMTVDMAEATLPVVTIKKDGYDINEMHGYVNRMQESTIRDSITPIGEDRAVTFTIEKYGSRIQDISFEVRSADGNRLIEDTKILDYSDYQDTLEATVNLKDLIEAGTEYNLVIVPTLADGRKVYYYTRVIQNDDAAAGEKIKFTLDFCSKTFNKNAIKELSTYLEPNSEGDNSTFGRVNIHSSLKQVAWGDMEPVMESQPRVTIKEIGDTMASVELKYTVSTNAGDNKYYYNVDEYYRVRKTPQRFYLLSFDRTMDQIFVMDKSVCSNDKLLLGIKSEDIPMMESEGGDVFAFVDGGRLYGYNVPENKLARLFAFYDSIEDDPRNRYLNSDIKILDVEENGDVSFMVYGYMNRGMHEGEVGVEVCYFRSMVNTIEEQAFIPYYKSADILKCDVEKLSYQNYRGDLFLFMDGVIYEVAPETLEYKVIADNIDEDTFFISQSGKTIVWQESGEESDGLSNLVVMDLVAEQKNTIEKKANEHVKPIGFMNEDLAYGISEESDIVYNILGDITFPMNRVVISSETGKVLKDYDIDGIYVTSGSIEGNQITLKRVKKNEITGVFDEITDDQITSNTEIKEGKNKVAVAVTDTYEKIVQIAVKNVIDTKSLKFLTPKEVLYEGGRSLKIKESNDKLRFLVYGAGEVVAVFDNPAAAALTAYSIRGTVTDVMGNEIYKRAETQARNQIMAVEATSTTESKDSLAVCLDTMLKLQGISRNTEYMLNRGDSVYMVLENNLIDSYVLNLTGCTMDMMLYYVNQDIPVLALKDNGQAVLIIGFNEQNVVLMDPSTGTIYKSGMNDSRQMFEEAGNRFLTYSVKTNDK